MPNDMLFIHLRSKLTAPEPQKSKGAGTNPLLMDGKQKGSQHPLGRAWTTTPLCNSSSNKVRAPWEMGLETGANALLK